MTAVAAAALRVTGWSRRRSVALPPLSPGRHLARAALLMVCVISLALLADLLVLSALQQRSSQQRLYDRFRRELAQGTAPVSPVDLDGRALAVGDPVAYVEIPSIGVRQVVVEGTSAGTLFAGPGHRRDTPLPGQPGTSIVLGRRAAFGGPFADLGRLRPGATVHVTTGQGAFAYRVLGVRHEGDPAPAPPAPGAGRLVLVTAAGRPFMPAGALRVDAELDGPAVAGARPAVAPRALPAPEHLMEGDTGTLWALVLWLQALTLVVLGAVWAWHRWSPARAWLAFFPPLLVVALAASGEAARLLPNLL